jgi:hypothetical protein
MALFEILKKGAPRRRGLASSRIDAALKVDITPYPMRDRGSTGNCEGWCHFDTKIAFLLTLREMENLLK